MDGDVGHFAERTWVVMPAYNAARTLEDTYNDLPPELQSQVILVDDCSSDETVEIAESLGLVVIRHTRNTGYGGNQKTCYRAALDRGAEYVVMVHPDFQYDARMASVMVEIIALGNCDIVLGNRIRTRREAREGGMPLWKYLANRSSTLVENLILGQSIGDFHSGMRAYSRTVLESLPLHRNSDDFSFDQELLVQAGGWVQDRRRSGARPVHVGSLVDQLPAQHDLRVGRVERCRGPPAPPEFGAQGRSVRDARGGEACLDTN